MLIFMQAALQVAVMSITGYSAVHHWSSKLIDRKRNSNNYMDSQKYKNISASAITHTYQPYTHITPHTHTHTHKYLLECLLCKVQYIRKSETPFHIRLNNHRKDIKNPNTIEACQDFNNWNKAFQMHEKSIYLSIYVSIYLTYLSLHLPACLSVGLPVCWSVGQFICQSIGQLVGWLFGQLVGQLVGWLVGLLIGWLVAWLVGWLVGQSVYLSTYSYY